MIQDKKVKIFLINIFGERGYGVGRDRDGDGRLPGVEEPVGATGWDWC